MTVQFLKFQLHLSGHFSISGFLSLTTTVAQHSWIRSKRFTPITVSPNALRNAVSTNPCKLNISLSLLPGFLFLSIKTALYVFPPNTYVDTVAYLVDIKFLFTISPCGYPDINPTFWIEAPLIKSLEQIRFCISPCTWPKAYYTHIRGNSF